MTRGRNSDSQESPQNPGNKPAGALSLILQDIVKGWSDITHPSAKMLTVLNEEENFTEEALRIHSFIENGVWEWFDCRWRGKKYSYGRLDQNPITEEEKQYLKKGEHRALEQFWQEFTVNPQKLMKEAAETEIHDSLYHPNVEPLQETNKRMLEHMAKVLKHRDDMEKVKGLIIINHNWLEEMKRMKWEGKPNHNFIAMERETWITSAELDDNPDKKLIKAIRELKAEEVQNIYWRKRNEDTQDLILQVRDRLFNNGWAESLEKKGIPLRDETLKVELTPPREKYKNFSSALYYKGKPITGVKKKIIDDLRMNLRRKIQGALREHLTVTKAKILSIVEEKAREKKVNKEQFQKTLKKALMQRMWDNHDVLMNEAVQFVNEVLPPSMIKSVQTKHTKTNLHTVQTVEWEDTDPAFIFECWDRKSELLGED